MNREMKMADEELRRYECIVSNSQDLMALLDRDFFCLAANKAFAQAFGMTCQQIVGNRQPELFETTHFRRSIRTRLQHCLAGNEVRHSEWFDFPTTGLRYIDIAYTPFFGPDDEMQGFVAIGRDITERKRAEDALEKKEERARTLINSAPAVIGYVDKDLLYQQVNRPFLESYGVTEREIIGTPVAALIGPENFNESQGFIEKVLEGREVTFDIRRTVKDLGLRDLNVNFVPDVDEKGQVAGFYFRTQDVTESKQMDAQLQHAQRMESVGTLAGGVAHNFNNLLQVIMGNVSLLLREMDESHPHHGTLNTILDRLNSGSELASQLLGYARGGKYHTAVTNLNVLLVNVVRVMAPIHKEISINQRLESGLWNTKADAGQIEQVVMNVFVNACQAMPNGGEIIVKSINVTLGDTFSKLHDVKPGQYVKLSVADNGTGMNQETLSKVFDPFFTTKEIARGSGLGLASAFGIIKNHGGFISVDSEMGRGTTFDIYLPATEERIVALDGAEELERKGSGTILFVDDDEGVASVGRSMLEVLGYDPWIAHSGSEAVKLYSENQDNIDLVILDMIMPTMSGGQVYGKLKEMDPNVKVILSSGFSIEDEARKIMARGCDGFIQKPFSAKILSERIHGVLNRE